MSTEAQTKANRANSLHSTGPKTAEGKSASCLNNFRTGLTGSAFSVLSWEDEQEYETLHAAIRAQLEPRGPFESLLVERMAQHQWLSLRAVALQTGCFYRDEPGSCDEKQLALFLRYQTTHDRAYNRLFNDLLKLRAEARKAQIGFESQKRADAALALRQSAENRRVATTQNQATALQNATAAQNQATSPHNPAAVPAPCIIMASTCSRATSPASAIPAIATS